ncbi:MAG: hypothetical protein HYT76_00925 [Deltaproteobacteria bacterium]|nr:hypothetical protein [Deltaproteobacteria bacterium]
MSRFSRFLVVFLILLPNLGSARSTSFDTLRLRAAPDQGRYLTIYDTDMLKPYEWTTGVFLDYARAPLSVVVTSGATQAVVEDLVGLHLSGSIGLLDWLEVGLNPNFAILEKFFDTTTNTSSTRIRAGDTRLNAKLRILEKGKYPVGIVFVPYLDLPIGSGASLVGNNSFAGGGLFSIETPQIEERLSFAFNLGYWTRDSVLVFATQFDDLMTFGIAGNFIVLKKLELYSEFSGGTMVSDFFSSSGTPVEGGGGARYFLTKDRRWQMTGGVFLGVGSGLGNPVVRGLVGVAFTPSRAVRGVEMQEAVTETFSVYELKEPTCPFDIEGEVTGSIPATDPRCQSIKNELLSKCPEKKDFNPERDDIRCLKLYLSE